MMLRLRRLLVVAGAVMVTVPGSPMSRSDDSAGVLQDEPVRTIRFQTDEGTRMHVDVSSDGETLVFDLLGDLYTLPITGGTAVPLLTDRAWDRSPQWSPDGASIAFLSDRLGVSNVWTLDVAANRLSQVTSYENDGTVGFGAQGTPTWLPKGDQLAYAGPKRGELHIVSARGGVPRALLPPGMLPSNVASSFVQSPTFTPDAGTAFLEVTFQLADFRAPLLQNYRTVLYQLETGTGEYRELTASVPERHEFTPRLSRSGVWLAYGRRDGGGEPELRVRNRQTGEDRRLFVLNAADDPFSTGHWEDSAIPAYAFTPDDRFIVLWSAGKLYRVALADGRSEVIPFTVHVSQTASEPVRGRTRIADGPLMVRALRWPSLTPDGQTLVFSAVGHLWRVAVGGGPPVRLTSSDTIETMPAVSPDGNHVAYVAFERAADAMRGPGVLMLLDLRTRESTQVLDDNGATYYLPSWAPDGTKLGVIREVGSGSDAKAEFGWVDIPARAFHTVREARPFSRRDLRGPSSQGVVFSHHGRRLLMTSGSPVRAGISTPTLELYSVKLDGTDLRRLATAEADVKGLVPAPDASHVLLHGWDGHVYLAQVANSQSAESKPLSTLDDGAQRVSRTAALHPTWRDRSTFTYGWLNTLYSFRIGDSESTVLRQVQLEIPRREGTRVIAFQNGRLITMDGERGAGQVIDRGSIVVRGARIAAVGKTESVPIPADALVIDASGWTLMPGLVETHMHGLLGSGIGSTLGYPLTETPDLSNALAYGVTTAWDAFESFDDGALERIEMIEAGRLLGPRWLHAGGAFAAYLRNGGIWRTDEGVRSLVRTQADLGAACLKNNHWYERTSQRWWAEEARRQGLCVIGHGQYAPQMLAMGSDGIAVDHFSLPTPSYRDVVQWLVLTGTIWTPHARGAGSTWGGPQAAALRSFIDELKESEDAVQLSKLQRFGRNPRFLDWYAKYPPIRYERTTAARVHRLAAVVVRAGGTVVASADAPNNSGQMGIHAEIWGFHRGGMSAGDALRSGTKSAAEKLGIQSDVGALEPGKLADLLVLTGNPLDRIENTLKLKYTVVAGVIYDSTTTAIVHPARLAEDTP